jgi:hypothetical protein
VINFSNGTNNRVYGQGDCSWKEGHYFTTSSNIHQENYSGDRQEAGSREHGQAESSSSNPGWIETFLEGVTDKSTGLPLFSELSWFVYKVSGVMCSESVCEHYWSIEGWIHSQRRNRLHQKLVENLVRAHTNLVLSESLDDTLRDLLPWDIDLVIDESVDEKEEEPEA